jgi:MYXO-CTERM domain-containing protein
MRISFAILSFCFLLGFASPSFGQCNDNDTDGDGYSCLSGDCNDSNPSVNPDALEVCNGVDDNCDTVIDNPPDKDGDGRTVCQGDCNDNDPQQRPGLTEVCDGKDNDCDGLVDERDNSGNPLQQSCYSGPSGTRNVGICRGGMQTCVGGSYASSCVGQILPGTEICDAQDNDCDSQTDEGFDADGDGVSTCAGDCNDGNPNIRPNATETCNGVDDDCDTRVDERDNAGNPLQQSCYGGPGGTQNVGICRGGTQNCVGGTFSGTCNGQVLPGTEICDGLNNDCDGQTDEGFDADGDGVSTCAGDCNDNNPNIRPNATEVCNGIDDDCDTRIDERNNAGDPLQRSCYSGPGGTQNVGICRAGTEVCVGGSFSGTCNGQVLPGTEICDGLNNDCDGQTDEGFDADGDGVTTCAGDCNDNNPNIRPNATEVCNGIDDDCDTRIDERDNAGNPLQRSCYTGPGGTQNVGVCRAGTEVCVGGSFSGTCNGQVLPGTEICDGLNNDCDGQTDEGFDADGDGVSTCAGDCNDNNPNIRPNAAEVCNGIDDDCDTLVDERNNAGEPLRQNCYGGPGGTQNVGICRGGTQNCSGGTYSGACNGQILPGTEVCDAQDNDCDNQNDEGFDQDADGITSCAGDCNDNDPAQKPGLLELCDGKDNDCDTLIDEDAQGNLLTRACYSGNPATANIGECIAGVNQCAGTSGFGTACVGERLPASNDPCDGKDNNCNGQTDEDFDQDGDGFTSCGGDCNDNDPNINPGALELCNNIDDDCNGIADGSNTDCYTGPSGTQGVGECRSGISTCTNGQPTGTCNGQILPAQEICDRADNDCDGQIDEDFDNDRDGVVSCAAGCASPCDCDDSNPFVAPNLPERCDCTDNDCDGRVDERQNINDAFCQNGACHDFDDDGFTNCEGDCDDERPGVFPGARESCTDNVDNDCDGVVDEDVDEDGDGVSTCAGDCDDRFAAISPLAVEACDAVDNDCDGRVDEGFDKDNDNATTCAGDCNDNDRNINPLRKEVCNDGIDNDCDGTVDPDGDADGDGVLFCNGDCNDFNAAVYPGAPEVCDGVDNDCNGTTKVDGPFDVDNDRFATCLGDCNDAQAAINPDAREVPSDGIDNDCDGQIDEGSADLDGDGFTFFCGDCDEGNPNINPHEPDVCDGIDNDCDGAKDRSPVGALICQTCNDTDGDLISDCDGDCDDTNAAVRPGGVEVCDGLDNDCDGTIDLALGTRENLCIVTDAGPRPERDASTGSDPDGSVSDGGVNTDGSIDGDNPPSTDQIDIKCGCETVGSSEDGAPWALGLLALCLPLVLRRKKRSQYDARRPSSRLGMWWLAMLIGISAPDWACTNFDVGGDGLVGDEDSGTGSDPDARPPRIRDGGTTGIENCPLVNPDSISALDMPGRKFRIALHQGMQTVVNADLDAIIFDDDGRGIHGFALSVPASALVDPSRFSSASDYIENLVDPLLSAGLPGVTGVASRKENDLKQAFIHRSLPAARTLQRVTMVNDVLPQRVRDGMLSELSRVNLYDIDNLPSFPAELPTRDLLLSVYAEVDGELDSINVVVAIIDEFNEDVASNRISDLNNGTHVAAVGTPLEVNCPLSVAANLAVDFLWVVDNSNSMLEEQQALSQAADRFFTALEASRIDFRLGVVTTDGEILRGGSFTTNLDTFRERVQVGINGSGTEQGLEFALRALDRAKNSVDPQQALRANAIPVVIIVSDEESTNIRPTTDYINNLRSFNAIAFAIVGPNPRGCLSVGRGQAQAGSIYIDVAEGIGGTSASICTEDLSGPINEILFSAAGAASKTRLPGEPISGSIEITLDDETEISRSRDDGFDYAPGTDSILFFGNANLVPGTEFRISYYAFAKPDV